MIITNDCGEKQIVVHLGETVDDIVEQMFLVAYGNNSGNLRKICKALGISYRTVRNWKKKYGALLSDEETV